MNVQQSKGLNPILMMWICFIVAALNSRAEGFAGDMAGLAALGGIGLAIYLVTRPGRKEKIHGWIVLGINLLGLLIMASIGMSVPHGP